MALKRKDNVGIVVDDLGGTIDFFRELGLELDLTELFSDALSEVAAPGTSFMERRKDSYRALRRASTAIGRSSPETASIFVFPAMHQVPKGNPDDPMPGVISGFAYMQGVVAGMGHA